MRFFQLIIAVVLLALPVQAQNKDIEAVISNQIAAFQKDDFETAFTYAAPNIKQMFRTSDNFGRMVVNGYPMVHRPSDVQFQTLSENAGVQVQTVLIRDGVGNLFLAEYRLIPTKAGWKISGVSIIKAPGVGV